MNHVDIFQDRVLLRLGPVPITTTVATTVGVTAALLLVAVVLRAALRHRPQSTLALLAMLAYEWLEALVSDIVGRPVPWLVTFAGSLFFSSLAAISSVSYRA
jgi:F0F1-type ATP synthase membrane subunit a